MDKWVKVGVIAQIACVVFAIWGVYRQENPLPIPSSIHDAEKQPAVNGKPWMNPVWYGPIVSGGLLVISVCLFVFAGGNRASRQKSMMDSDLVIHHAWYGIGRRFWQHENVTKKVQALVKNNSLNMLARDALSDPYPEKPKVLTVRYSLATQAKDVSVADGVRLILPDGSYSKKAWLPQSRAAIAVLHAEEADYLREMLENTWHMFDNAGLKLVRPLVEDFADQIDFQNKQALDCVHQLDVFRFIYWHDLDLLKYRLSDFRSSITEDVRYSEVEYVSLRRDLSTHADLLRGYAKQQLSSMGAL